MSDHEIIEEYEKQISDLKALVADLCDILNPNTDPVLSPKRDDIIRRAEEAVK